MLQDITELVKLDRVSGQWVASVYVNGHKVSTIGATEMEALRRLVAFFVYRIENRQLDDLQ